MWPLALLHYNAFSLVLLLLWTECPQSSSGTSPRHIKHFTCFMWHLVTPISILNCGWAYISGEGLRLEPHEGYKTIFYLCLFNLILTTLCEKIRFSSSCWRLRLLADLISAAISLEARKCFSVPSFAAWVWSVLLWPFIVLICFFL